MHMQKSDGEKYLLSLSFLISAALFLVQIITFSLKSNTAEAAVAEIDDQGSGWEECRGWTDSRYITNGTIIYKANGDEIGGMHLCRREALRLAKGGNYYYPEMNPGLTMPPSGDKDATSPGSHRQWYNWGLQETAKHFLSVDTACGLGPNVCIPKPSPTPTATRRPSNTPTVRPSHTPTVSPTHTVIPSHTPTVSPTPTVRPSHTPTVSPTHTVSVTLTPTSTISVSITPSITASATPTVRVTTTPRITASATPVATPTPGVKGEDTIYGFSLQKNIVGASTYKVGELITYNVVLENSGTEVITKINMRDVFTSDMRAEVVYLVQNGQRRNVTTYFFATESEKDGGSINPKNPLNKSELLDLTDLTGDLKPGSKITLEFIFKAVGKNTSTCNQAYASANSRSEISSQKVCVNVSAIVPVTD